MNATLSIFLALVLIGSTTLVLHKFHKKNSWWQDWLKTCVSVLASALIAIPIGISIYRSQIQIDSSEQRTAYVSVLQKQLTGDLDALNTDGGIEVPLSTGKRRINTPPLIPDILEEAAKSNLFDVDLANDFLDLARKIRFYNLLVEYFMSVISNTNPTINQLDLAVLNLDLFKQKVISKTNEVQLKLAEK